MEKYRFFDVHLHNLSNGYVAFYSTHRDHFWVYPNTIVDVLTSCKEFKTLDDHAIDYLRMRQGHMLSQPVRSPVKKFLRFFASKMVEYGGELPIPARDLQAINDQLETFVKDGFLISRKDLYEKVLKAVSGYDKPAEEPQEIKILGIPTRNRGALLARCVQSYLKNLHQGHRECAIHFVDDSDEDIRASQNGQAVAELLKRHQVANLWVDRQYRMKFARAIARASGAPENVTRFALLGDSRCGIRTGASRNTLLLLAAGEPSVQVDDDTICRITPSPGMDSGVALSSEADCNRYWYYNNPDTAMKQARVEDIDFLSLHETLLGKHPAALIREHTKINIDHMGGRLLETFGHPDARTAVTYLGALGDSGMFRHWQRICFEGDSFRRLVEDGSTYMDYVRTRQIFRGPAQMTIGDGPFCMAMNIGLDTRRLLPPFMPVQRMQDGIFGQLLSLGFKQASRGYAPYAILHDLPDRSSHTGLLHALSVGPLRTNDVLEAVLWSLDRWPFGSDTSQNLYVIGRYLSDLSRLPPQYFKVQLREVCLRMIHMRINRLQRCIHERADAPGYWQRDARQVLWNFQALALREDLCVPCDLPGNASERLTLFQKLMGKFGQLLIYWPAIWEAAVQLREDQELSTEVKQHKGVVKETSPGALNGKLFSQLKKQMSTVKKTPEVRKKKVLMIAPYFLPRRRVGSLRPFKFAIHLDEFGWEPHVITIKSDEGFTDLERKLIENVSIREIGYITFREVDMTTNSGSQLKMDRDKITVISGNNGGMGRGIVAKISKHFPLDTWLLFFSKNLDEIKEIAIQTDADVIWSTGDPWSSHWLANRLALDLKLPWIADFRDPWTLGEVNLIPRSVLSKFLDRNYEHIFIENADFLTFTSTSTEELYQAHYPSIKGRSATITNCFDRALVRQPENTDKHRFDERYLNLVFFGKFRRLSPAAPVVELLKIVGQKAPAALGKIRVYSFGNLANDAELAKREGVFDNFIIEAPIPPEEGSALLSKADILLLSTDPRRSHIIPAKLWDYLAVGRPILSIAPNPEIGEILKKTGAGVHFSPSQKSEITDFLIDCVRAKESGKELPVFTGLNRDQIDQYDARNTTRRLVEILGRLVNNS